MSMRDYHKEIVAILDFGSQYTQLIARKVRELKVYCEILPYNADIEKLRVFEPPRDNPLAEVHGVSRKRMRPHATLPYSIWVYRSSVSAMGYN